MVKRSDLPAGRRLRCLLVNDRDDGLSLALAHYLSCELVDIEFTLDEERGGDVVWLCASQPDDVASVRRLRTERPWSLLVVTRRGATEAWRQAALAAGADLAASGPLDHARLVGLLRRAQRLASRAGVAS